MVCQMSAIAVNGAAMGLRSERNCLIFRGWLGGVVEAGNPVFSTLPHLKSLTISCLRFYPDLGLPNGSQSG